MDNLGLIIGLCLGVMVVLIAATWTHRSGTRRALFYSNPHNPNSFDRAVEKYPPTFVNYDIYEDYARVQRGQKAELDRLNP